MSETKIKVPQDMLKTFGEVYDHQKGLGADRETCERFGLEATLRWLDEKLKAMMVENKTLWQAGRNATIEDVRRMFLAPEPEPYRMKMPKGTMSAVVGWEPNTNRLIVGLHPNTAEQIEFARSMGGSGFTPAVCFSLGGPQTEEAVYERVRMAMGAITLSREEGDQIIEYVRGAIHDGIDRASQEPEVTEEIKDLYWIQPKESPNVIQQHNEQILEAYHRGKEGTVR